MPAKTTLGAHKFSQTPKHRREDIQIDILETVAAKNKYECKFPYCRDTLISQRGRNQHYLYKHKYLLPSLVTNASSSGKSTEASPEDPENIVYIAAITTAPPPQPATGSTHSTVEPIILNDEEEGQQPHSTVEKARPAYDINFKMDIFEYIEANSPGVSDSDVAAFLTLIAQWFVAGRNISIPS